MTKYIRYYLLCVMLSMVLFHMSIVHASVVSENSCNAFAGVDPNAYARQVVADLGDDLQIFKEQDLKVVVRHLQAHCCDGLSGESSCTQAHENSKYHAPSAYITDHLIDIGMRKLDGVEAHCDAYAISCEMANPLIRAQERREKITEVAEDPDGYPPLYIYDLFREYWGDTVTMTQDENLLRNAYNGLCQEIAKIAVFDNVNVSGLKSLTSDDTIESDKRIISGTCIDLVTQRYIQEANYVKTILVEEGIRYLNENLKNYMIDYMVQNRLRELANVYTKLDGCFATVLNYSTNTVCCNE